MGGTCGTYRREERYIGRDMWHLHERGEIGREARGAREWVWGEI
jgi:hypothetical protein